MFPERFKTAEQMHIATSNLHKMVPLDTPLENAPEEDLRFVYAVRDYETDSYRWGVCVSSQSISYVVADEKMDLDAELDVQGEDGLPLVMRYSGYLPL